MFIKLVRSKFLKNNKSHKIFSLNLLKISYCCTTNAGNIIKQHNSKVLSKTNDNKIRKCNCRSKPNCPWNGECLNQCLVYKATSATCSNSLCLLWNFWSGVQNTVWQPCNFRQSECMNETELSKHVWNLKDDVLDNNLSFEIHRKAFPYQYGSKRCDLRLSE